MKYAVFTVAGFEGFLGQLGLPAILAWPIILGEFLGGLALILGIYPRLVSAGLLPILIGALAVHAPNGWMFSAPNGGWEYPAFLAAATLTPVLSGGGAFALTGQAAKDRVNDAALGQIA